MEAAVIGIRHPKWDERPLLIVIPKKGESPTREELLGFMEGKIAKWWMPDDVVFVERDPAHRDGQDPEDRAARPVQGLHAADRRGCRRVAHVPRKPSRREPGGIEFADEACASKNQMDTFDYVIVGAGTAGCVLANRLSADAGVSVCVLEAGPRDWHPYIHIPAGFIKLFHQPRPELALHPGAERMDRRAAHPRAARQDARRIELDQRPHLQSRPAARL